MATTLTKQNQRIRRRARIRARIEGTTARPRLAVFRSNRFVYAQIIDDTKGVTLVSKDSRSSKAKGARERATETGKALAEAAKAKGIETVVFDRGGFQYQGVIAALADGAREGGLGF